MPPTVTTAGVATAATTAPITTTTLTQTPITTASSVITTPSIVTPSMVNTFVQHVSTTGNTDLAHNIKEMFKFAGHKCCMNHQFFLLKNLPNIPLHLQNLVNIYLQIYREHQDKKVSIISVIPSMCKPCLYVIFGLRDQMVNRNLTDKDCVVRPDDRAQKRFRMGH